MEKNNEIASDNWGIDALWMINSQTAIAPKLTGDFMNGICRFGLHSRKKRNDGW
jgi:hypothetical protein